MNQLKHNLQRLLQENGLAPTTFATKIGLQPTTVLRILSGKTLPRPGTIAMIANYFGLTSSQLTGDNTDGIPFNSETPLITKKLVPLLAQDGEDLTSIVREPASLNGTHQWVNLPFTLADDSPEIVAVTAKDSALKPDIRTGDIVYVRFDVEDIDDVPDGSYVLAEPADLTGPLVRKFVKGKDFASSFLVSTNPDWPKERTKCNYVLGVVIGRSGMF